MKRESQLRAVEGIIHNAALFCPLLLHLMRMNIYFDTTGILLRSKDKLCFKAERHRFQCKVRDVEGRCLSQSDITLRRKCDSLVRTCAALMFLADV